MENLDQHTSGTMEQLLKRAYTVHKDVIKGVTVNLTKYKAAYTKTVEKCHQLQRINDELESENRKLSTAITTKQGRDGSCCEVIRQSLDTVISSYKQMLADKDTRIYQLEDELNRLRRSAGNVSSEQLCVKSSLVFPQTSPEEHVEQNPDSTSCTTPKVSRQRLNLRLETSAISPDEELVFDTSTDDTVKLKLNRKRSKRSRYSEDVSPDHKKPRKLSPLTETVKTANKHKAQSSDSSDTQNKETKLSETANNKTVEKGRNGKRKKDSHKILVSDTCVPDLNESLVSKGFDTGGPNGRKESDLVSRKQFDTSVLVVPETLAVDMDDTFVPEDSSGKTFGKAGEKFEPELTDISEGCEESNTLCASNDETKVETDFADQHLKKSLIETKAKTKRHKSVEIPESFRSILESSESDSEKGKKSDSCDLDLDCDSLVKDSDEETFFDSLPSSQTFVKSKPKGKLGNDNTDRNTRNTCKNMEEVNALFETPARKDSTNENSEKAPNDTGTRKPLFKKGKKENLQKEVQNEVILRRSPRKHKPVKTYRPPQTPTKVRTKLDQGSSSPKGKRESQIRNNEGFVSDDSDNDLTIAPEHSVDHQTECESETIDCYNVMPVKDGNLVPSRKFQVKVKGMKKSNNSKALNEPLDCERRTVQIVNVNETLKSPSILGQDLKSNSAVGSEVIAINSSSSRSSGNGDNNNSNAESPLMFKTDRNKEHIDDDLEIVDWKSTKSRKKKSDSQNSLSLSSKRTSLRSSQHGDQFKKPGKDVISITRKSSPKGLQQTTLTQKFFSPKKMSKKKNTEVGEQSKIETMKLDKECSVLRELKDQNGNSGVGGRLNGSLDPSAELSEWCKDPETLPSLDTDFCEADLRSGENSPPKTSTLAVEDTQDIPCSSTSYKFLPKKPRRKDIENTDPQRAAVDIDDSFDRLPKNKGSGIAHVAVVRKRDERQKLQGHGCKECLQYYKSAGRSDEEIKQHMHQCSRHRAQYVPPDTPPHFWSVGFIETQENDDTVVKESEIGLEEESDVQTYRRRKRLNKCFRSKNENSVLEDDT
ncbi:uncharacterized protein LOC123541222 [Mercenaria mercenaria]|uniref:uncharacterized protein LOC123541222 n=1 Tax=Mercenaria mercenaria TaxID=6596 RepID=UPI00234F5EE3|nr:uncharacterized protein LOC123541222 [Mercenaria mercenaria]XP_053383178.1 uncharacterized protein LOC123541222 [Mercenaria mercenaria]